MWNFAKSLSLTARSCLRLVMYRSTRLPDIYQIPFHSLGHQNARPHVVPIRSRDCYASLYAERQAPVTVRPEGAQVSIVRGLGRIFPDEPPISPKLFADEPPIKPKQATTLASCGNTEYTFTDVDQTGTLTSENYDRWISYPENQRCAYTIRSPPGTQMTLECKDFNVACPNDKFSYSLDGGQTKKSNCGNVAIPSVTTEGNTLVMGFTSGRKPLFSWFTRYRYKCKIASIAGDGSGEGTTTPGTPPRPPGPGSCSCGVRNVNGATRIVGGIETKSGELPWRVAVSVYDLATRSISGICGGTVIRNWVMTAAHCTMDNKPGDKIYVYVGAQANPVTVGGATATIVVDRYVQHPSFNRRTLDNDMALLHLSKPLTFKSNISPACLPYPLVASDFSGTKVLASGWGTTEPVAAGVDNNDAGSDTLLEVDLPVLSTTECREYQNVTDNMICTYEPGKDTCQGDSGGSIVYKYTDTRYYSIGVVSYGVGCAQEKYPGVYTKVTNYLPWIEKTTQDTFCKP